MTLLLSLGAEIVTNATVTKILTESRAGSSENKVVGVRMQDGSELRASTVISATTPYHTFMELMGEGLDAEQGAAVAAAGGSGGATGRGAYSKALPEYFSHHIKHTG